MPRSLNELLINHPDCFTRQRQPGDSFTDVTVYYLEASDSEVGLVINFGLKSLQFKRIVNKQEYMTVDIDITMKMLPEIFFRDLRCLGFLQIGGGSEF